MTFKKNQLLLFLILGTSNIIFFSHMHPIHFYSLESTGKIKNGKACIFIHGTTNIVPLIEPLLGRHVDKWLLDRIKALSDVWLHEFTDDSFYVFRWPGDFNIQVRKRAAQRLYDAVCSHEGPLTIIGHSHGCSIALYLAELCRLHKNTTLKIDKLILLAPPVQEATAPLVRSKIFKRVFSFYSSADILQIIAPQRLTITSRKKCHKVFYGSKRVLPESPNLIQARVLINHQSPSHIDFCYRFLQRLPSVLAFLEQHVMDNNRHVIINVPTDGDRPSFLRKEELAHAYVPRVKRKPRRRLKREPQRKVLKQRAQLSR